MNTFLIILCFQVAAIFAAPGVPDTSSFPPTVTPQLESSLKKNGVAKVFVTLKASTSSVLATIAHSSFNSRDDKLNALHSALQQHSQKSQEPILNHLLSNAYSEVLTVHSYWITNQIYIKNANSSLITDLASKFSHLILSFDEEFFAHLIQPVSIQTNVSVPPQEEEGNVQWGVEKIQAPEAWKKLGGILNAGNGVVVATIDTGVRGTHEALGRNFIGEYGWYDPGTGTPSPTDNNGHGTHTMGTIAGSRGIGVAPQVRWAACRGCAGVFCAQSHLLACGEFFLCPTLPDGSRPNCSKAPHIVSNSWGGGRGNTWYNGVIDAWHAAGIIPVFSIGNSGPICSTPSSPGDQENVIAVGSTMNNDAISTFSSAGPTLDGRIKPEVTAPGSDVVSAYHTNDNAYASISGTSMAGPSAAGTLALLLTRDKRLSYQQAKNLLMENTDQNLRFSLRVCQGIRDNVFPNHVFGSGRINAFKSIQAQARLMLESTNT